MRSSFVILSKTHLNIPFYYLIILYDNLLGNIILYFVVAMLLINTNTSFLLTFY